MVFIGRLQGFSISTSGPTVLQGIHQKDTGVRAYLKLSEDLSMIELQTYPWMKF
jgi:hypothetical protein